MILYVYCAFTREPEPVVVY